MWLKSVSKHKKLVMWPLFSTEASSIFPHIVHLCWKYLFPSGINGSRIGLVEWKGVLHPSGSMYFEKE